MEPKFLFQLRYIGTPKLGYFNVQLSIQVIYDLDNVQKTIIALTYSES